MKIKNKKVLCFGEILWDRLPSGSKPGGAPMNVALHLNAIGQEVAIASRIGNDQAGKDLVTFLEKSGLKTDLTTKIMYPYVLNLQSLDGWRTQTSVNKDVLRYALYGFDNKVHRDDEIYF